MDYTRVKKALLLAICIFAVILRLVLAFVNAEANDSHVEISRIILNENRIPSKEECAECYHPKLYHFSIAQLWKTFPSLDQDGRIILAQQVNALAGILTIGIIWLFLKRLSFSTDAKLLTFALVALNPRLIGINGQATNDSFAILFATAALYCLYRFLQSAGKPFLFGITVFTILAVISKGTGLVIFLSITLVLAIRLVFSGGKKAACDLMIFLILFMAVAPVAGEYYAKYRKYGSPFVFNLALAPHPDLFKETVVLRPGVTSVVHGFLTFRLIDMIKTPAITNWGEYPRHRTSLWSQLYGRAHFLFFDQWPPSWQTSNAALMNLGRAVLILGLIPTLIIFFRLLHTAGSIIMALTKWNRDFFTHTHEWSLHIVFWAYLAFVAYFNYLYRDFSCMKWIYILPGILAMTHVLATGIDGLLRTTPAMLKKVFVGALVALTSLYVVSVCALIGQLGS